MHVYSSFRTLVTCRRSRKENHGIHLAIFDGIKARKTTRNRVYPSYLCRHESDTDLLHTVQSFPYNPFERRHTFSGNPWERYEISFAQTYRPRRIFHALNRGRSSPRSWHRYRIEQESNEIDPYRVSSSIQGSWLCELKWNSLEYRMRILASNESSVFLCSIMKSSYVKRYRGGLLSLLQVFAGSRSFRVNNKDLYL